MLTSSVVFFQIWTEDGEPGEPGNSVTVPVGEGDSIDTDFVTVPRLWVTGLCVREVTRNTENVTHGYAWVGF